MIHADILDKRSKHLKNGHNLNFSFENLTIIFKIYLLKTLGIVLLIVILSTLNYIVYKIGVGQAFLVVLYALILINFFKRYHTNP